MNETLSSKFQKSHGAALKIDGIVVRPIFESEIAGAQQRFVVRRVSSVKSPIQGISIEARNGKIHINGQSHSHIVLWADTSPANVEIMVTSKAGCRLKVWNIWRAGDITQAWVGNAGLVATESSDKVRLECSDGTGDAIFTDLIVELEKC